MHSALALAALLATAAIAKPVLLNKKRDMVVVTETDVVYQYVYVTATADGAVASTTADAVEAATTAARAQSSFSHYSRKHSSSSSSSPAPAPVTTVTTSAAPAPTTPVQQTTSSPEPKTTPAATSTVAEQTSSAASAPSSVASTYQQAVLLHHNLHRTNHSAPNIQWSDSLASIANQWASECNYEHNTDLGGGGYGQNIAAGAPPSAISNVITDMMYNGEMPYYASYYGDDNPDFSKFDEFGHFTQIVWKGTTSVGCATVQCSNGLANVGSGVSPYMTVCNYSPPGNMGGEYGDNIGQPLGESTITGSYGISS